MKPNSLSEVLKKGIRILAEAGIEEAGLDAWLLLEFETGYNRAFYFAHPEQELSELQMTAYFQNIENRSRHIPLQHLTHQAWFMGHEFYVNEHVLVPRQDTECLVELALQILRTNYFAQTEQTKDGESKQVHILDMCTGSGCILLSILAEMENTVGIGCDLSEKALEVAGRNAEQMNLTARAEFARGDLFEADCFCKNDSRNTAEYDMIISNPPYIATAEIEKLSEEVKVHDPMMALDGKEDGLYFYRKITRKATAFLKKGGYLLYEIGYDQGESVSSIMKEHGFLNVKVQKDLAGLDRIVYGIL
ncbi:MAG: peptide chain release factor N(5)-glutamine methyltransferase [Eubacteriales bacterium]|nr:peptide chain release factor N(5)-glutamine methyltransferase [Eubacteriales bacterium]